MGYHHYMFVCSRLATRADVGGDRGRSPEDNQRTSAIEPSSRVMAHGRHNGIARKLLRLDDLGVGLDHGATFSLIWPRTETTSEIPASCAASTTQRTRLAQNLITTLASDFMSACTRSKSKL
ncbi:MAG: hypothetical protein ACLT98_11490 [Eggerthellaceae bacterium]